MSILRLPRFSELATTAMLLLTASCQQCQTGVDSTGNLDRVNDLVVIHAPDGASYAVTANPELQHLRMFDLTAGRFLRSPNRFFPLSTPSAARELAVAVDVETTTTDDRRVFGLDTAADTIDVIHTSDSVDDVKPFTVLSRFATGRAPADLAALRFGARTLVAVTLPDASAVEIHVVDEAHAATLLTTVALPAGAHPERIVADPLGRAFIVGDAVVGVVYALEPDAEGTTVTIARTVDVGGPVGALAAGVVDVGDGLAPVVLALRTDRAAAMLVRLYRPGFPEDRYALLGGTELPRLGVTAYVPDVRPTNAPLTVCCTGLDDATVNAGEATADFGAVTVADGTVLYLQLAADDIDGLALEAPRRAVRLVDDDRAPPGPAVVRNADGSIAGTVDVNVLPELWVPATGGETRRPRATFTGVDTFGSPPFVPLLPAGSLLLVYDGGADSDLGGARNITGVFGDDGSFVTDTDLVAADVRAGDIARFEAADAPAGCARAFRGRITTVDVASIAVAVEGDDAAPALGAADIATCLADSADVRLFVEVGEAFAVTRDGQFLQRLAFGEPFVLPGVHLTMTASPAGPPLGGSRLAIPLDARVTTMGVDLVDSGGVLAMVPTAIAGGTVIIPDANSDDATATVAARRLVMSAAAADTRVSVPALFTCDEAETEITHVERLQ